MSQSPPTAESTDAVAREIAAEQAHVDRVYRELIKAGERADSVAADGLARGRTDRTGDVRDEEITGLFERDALVYAAAKRRFTIDRQYEGLVFGRLDQVEPASEVRYIGRLGVRDDDYEPLVIDWRAPAAAAFYRATPVDPMGVVRRRVLRCRGDRVIGIEDDLMVPEAPDGMVVVGDGALMAALTRTRGERMRDIVATIQRHQDEAIRASARGITEITGGPGTGKTVVALHRAAYLLYSDRRRYETGGILVVGPSAAYTAYIDRVLPSLGEDSVVLRALGDLVDGMTATRVDSPATAAVKGSLRMRRVLARLAARRPPEAPEVFRAFIAGHAVRLDAATLDRVRAGVLRGHLANAGGAAANAMLRDAAWDSVRTGERATFVDAWESSGDVEAFLASWWPQQDPREVLLRLADPQVVLAVGRGTLTHEECLALAGTYADALTSGEWTVADVALVDDLSARLGIVQETPVEERAFYDIDELDDLAAGGLAQTEAAASTATWSTRATLTDPLERLVHGRIERPRSYAHVLVDEAQDLSPMQWRMLGARGRSASWTVVGDAAQASWDDAAEAAMAKAEAYGRQDRRTFHMTTNYRNAREIFDYARDVVLPHVPDADIPDAVRETGNPPVVAALGDDVVASVREAVDTLLDQVDGPVAVISPARHATRIEAWPWPERVVLVDPLSAKGLEWDATVVVDPDAIVAESPGGVRVLYVALTRAAHRMTVLTA